MILPGQKSSSAERITSFNADLFGITLPILTGSFPDGSVQAVLLTKAKYRVPSPRVWDGLELSTGSIPYYSYHVWADDHNNPVHYWAGPAKLNTIWGVKHG